MLIDASILIDNLRGKSQATSFLNATRTQSGLITNSVVVAEILSGSRNLNDQREIDRLITVFKVAALEPTDCDLSISLLRQLKLSAGVGWHDCLIAATAIRLHAPVATLNEKHFRVIPALGVFRRY